MTEKPIDREGYEFRIIGQLVLWQKVRNGQAYKDGSFEKAENTIEMCCNRLY